jgi:hypothetical protein
MVGKEGRHVGNMILHAILSLQNKENRLQTLLFIGHHTSIHCILTLLDQLIWIPMWFMFQYAGSVNGQFTSQRPVVTVDTKPRDIKSPNFATLFVTYDFHSKQLLFPQTDLIGCSVYGIGLYCLWSW